ncbi:hypothetical protein PsorP6_000121 [Peronosclerospora sorghi]|uniref:Uncharacterized protein n=1 Tax=Peronosclerospora sorghi TaxID=230839 RepID=A0ACC0WYG2_9STRA|nr:hypothetical protein PsorP6_000121 [Peronosclerospora sorghi]
MESAVVPATKDSKTCETGLSASGRLLKIAEERKYWIHNREELLVRKEKLLKVLQLQSLNLTKHNAQKGANVTREAREDNKSEHKFAKLDDAQLTRKIELKHLLTQAKVAKEKQQLAASVLAQNLKQLQAKRKRAINRTDEQARKKSHVASTDTVAKTAVAPRMHPFGAAPDLDVGSPLLLESACFRIATRHFLQRGKLIPKEKLEQELKAYTGKALDEKVDFLSLASSLSCFDAKKSGETSPPSTSNKSITWQPGRQFLKTATFISSDAEQIQSMIEVEKEVVAALSNTLQRADTRGLKSSEIVMRHWQKSFLDIWLGIDATKPTLSAFLSAMVGINNVRPTSGNMFRIPNQPFGQMAGVILDMERWLQGQAEKRYSHNFSSEDNGLDGVSRICTRSPSSGNVRPFSIANESITKQLKKVETMTTRKIDSKRIMCHYELNGSCNDEKCSNYHQKDYEKNISYSTNDDKDARVVNLNDPDQLIQIFTEFRSRISKKWPLITTEKASVAAEKSKGGTTNIAIEEKPGRVDAVGSSLRAGAPNDDMADFLPLNVEEKPPEVIDARYFGNLDSKKATGDMLQARVKENPGDINAWLLLAIYQLDLDTGVSDEVVNLSDLERLKQQLCRLCEVLYTKVCSGGPDSLNIEEKNLKRCLHSISRALEIEANAYSEALWLLYLHLCRKVTSKQTEMDTVEQAVQFLPSSHALWLRYLSTFHFDSVGVAEGIYWGLLEHFARGDATESESNPPRDKQLSILLTAIAFHLCIRLWAAGATSRVTRMLTALLQLREATSAYSWCGMVRDRLRSEELIIFCLTFAHALLFQELPGLIEHWVVSCSDESIPVLEMTYNLDLFQTGDFRLDEDSFDPVVAAYALAFQSLENACSNKQDSGNTILTNWMLVLAIHDGKSKTNKDLEVFFKEKVDAIYQFPGASLVASKVMQSTLYSEERAACEPMLKMINQSTDDTFPEALHHYLLACRQFPSLMDALDKIFSDVMKRLASHVNFDIDRVEKSIREIMQDTSNVSKSCALKRVLSTLLAAWIEQLTLLRRRLNVHELLSQERRSLANICVALDICLLMGIWLNPSVAIDGLQTILSSSGFSILSYEARQLAWMQRFVFQVDLLQQEELDSTSWREHQARLSRLLRKYMTEMSAEAEIARQVSKHIRHNIGKNAIESAVYACFYPERGHLITNNVNLQLFRLCANAIVETEHTVFYASLTDSLALSPEFSLAFLGIAVHEWELLAARAGLRKCLKGAKTHHSQVLQALVAVELRLRNMKAVSCLLESEIEADPLLLEAWRLIVGLEILFGAASETRSKSIADELERRQLTFACNTFGDEKIVHRDISWTKTLEPAALNLRGIGLDRIPNAVLLKKELQSLDISGNKLTDLPRGLRHLRNLRQLDVSENALVELSSGIQGLTQLEELKLAHNNISIFPVLKVPSLSKIDIRWNTITGLPALAFLSQTALIVLQAEENAIPVDELTKVYDFLSRRNNNGPSDRHLDAQVSKNTLDGQSDEASRGSTDVRTANADFSKSKTVEEARKSCPVTEAVATQSRNTGNALTLDFTTSENGSNHMMTERNADASLRCELNNVSEIVMQESMDTSSTSGTIKANKDAKDVQDVIELDSTESLDKVAMTLDEQAVAASKEKVTSRDQVTDLSISTANKQPSLAVANTNAQDEYDVMTTLPSSQRQSSHAEAVDVRRKVATYMEEMKIQSRAQVREQSPSLWHEFLVASVPLNLDLPACRLCFEPNDGYNQRLNSMVLCLRCLEGALLVLKEQKGAQVENTQEHVADSFTLNEHDEI